MTARFEPGDRVRIARKTMTDDLWVPSMDDYVGKVLPVQCQAGSGLLVDGWWFPADALEPVEPFVSDHRKRRVILAGVIAFAAVVLIMFGAIIT